MEVTVQDGAAAETGPYSPEDQAILEGQEKPSEEAAPQEEGSNQELIGGKFKSADDLLTAYQELEKKLGATAYQSKEGEEQQPEVQQEEGTVEGDSVVLSKEEEQTILESIGGQENFTQVQDWARNNLDEAELEAYNREVNSGDYFRARNALQSMAFAYQDGNGNEPNLIGGKLSAQNTDVFRSSAEVEAAMNDPRYLVDSAYTNDVQEKVYRSDVLAPRS